MRLSSVRQFHWPIALTVLLILVFSMWFGWRYGTESLRGQAVCFGVTCPPERPFCTAWGCGQCTGDSDCGAGYRCEYSYPDTSICANYCTTNEECSRMFPGNSWDNSARPFCKQEAQAHGQCVQCLTDSDCGMPTPDITPTCSSEGFCMNLGPCGMETNCNFDQNGTLPGEPVCCDVAQTGPYPPFSQIREMCLHNAEPPDTGTVTGYAGAWCWDPPDCCTPGSNLCIANQPICTPSSSSRSSSAASTSRSSASSASVICPEGGTYIYSLHGETGPLGCLNPAFIESCDAMAANCGSPEGCFGTCSQHANGCISCAVHVNSSVSSSSSSSRPSSSRSSSRASSSRSSSIASSRSSSSAECSCLRGYAACVSCFASIPGADPQGRCAACNSSSSRPPSSSSRPPSSSSRPPSSSSRPPSSSSTFTIFSGISSSSSILSSFTLSSSVSSTMVSSFSSASSLCTAVCGNRIRECREECDDGNLRNDDSCNSSCQLENPFCGDFVIQVRIGETCEPSLTDPSDLCDPVTCTLRTAASSSAASAGYCCLNNSCYLSPTCTFTQNQCSVFCAPSSSVSPSSRIPLSAECGGGECTRGGSAFCALSNQTCTEIPTLPCLSCISPSTSSVALACPGNACARGGSTFCALSDQTCVDTPDMPCLVCVSRVASSASFLSLLSSSSVTSPSSSSVTSPSSSFHSSSSVTSPSSSLPRFSSVPFCGDARLDFGEECDDGPRNGHPASSCDAVCRIIHPSTDVLPVSTIELPFTAPVPTSVLPIALQNTTANLTAPVLTSPAPPQNTASGPATLAIMAAGASAGYAVMRRRKKG